MECLRLRVKDIDFENNQITVHDAKGMKDRITVLPDTLKPSLREHLERVKLVHQNDVAKGYGRVYLPYALERKYPKASLEWGWQYVFPAKGCPKIPEREKSDGIISMKTASRRQSKLPYAWLASPNR